MPSSTPVTEKTFFGLKLKICVFFYVIFAILFIAARVATWQAASHYFAPLTAGQIGLSFLHGMRFDLHILGILLCPVIALMMLPFRNKTVVKVLSALMGIMFVGCALFLAADVIFFGIFNNHIGVEIFTSFSHLGFFVQMAFQTYYYITVPLLIVLVILFYVGNKYISHYPANRTDVHFMLKSIVVLICLVPFIFFTLKGKIKVRGRNIGMMDAQVLGNAQTKDLILNGVYTTFNAIKKHQKRKLYFQNPYDGLTSVITPQETNTDPHYPFERSRLTFNKPNKNYNFVLVILESFDPFLIEEYPDVIPYFMKLKEQGTFYPNFMSSGGRSLIGVTATLFSVPYVWGLPTMKNGLGAQEFSRLASYFGHKGYRTLNVITDHASADNANLMSQYLGFDQFFSKPDIPVHHKYPFFHKGFDYEGLEFFLSKIKEGTGPFLGYFYTSTLHSPYNILVSKEYQKFPMDTEEHQFLNRAYYTDVALANFFEQARREPWFKDTIFLFLPDHRAIFSNRKRDFDALTREKYQSFLLMYGADIPAQINDTFATQEDILPTLLDMLNSSESYASSGQSLFDPYRLPYKFIYEEHDNTVHIIGPDTQYMVSEATLPGLSAAPAAVQNALQFNEAIYKSIRENTWKKK